MHIFINIDIKNNLLDLFTNIDKEKQIEILSSIHYIVYEKKGAPVPPKAKPLRDVGGRSLNEFRIKVKTENVRINYFVDKDNDRVNILNYYIKPDGSTDKNSYNKKNGKKLKNMIKEAIQVAENLYDIYSPNSQHYELYN